MHPFRKATALAAATVSLLLAVASPAGAATRSSDACTHNWSGPQVCIEIHGHDNWADRVVVRWTNPGSGIDSAVALLHEGDEGREVHVRKAGHRQGDQIVAEWTQIQLAWGKVCGSFTGTSGVWACQDVYSTTRS